MKNSQSIIYTIHNKEILVAEGLNRIKQYTDGIFEIIIVLDGCTDNSERIVKSFISKNPDLKIKLEYSDDVFETKANNLGFKKSESEYVIVVQDDMLINEKGWNLRLLKPFQEFSDVFAVSANCAHNWRPNENSKHIDMLEDLDNCWCDIIQHIDHAGRPWNLPRDVFAVRDCVNRGPLIINHQDLKKLNYLDESFAPLDMDDHDLCYRMMKEIGKVVGCYWIDFISNFAWGGTHENGTHKPWFFKSNHKNTKIVWNRHSNEIINSRKIENRKL